MQVWHGLVLTEINAYFIVISCFYLLFWRSALAVTYSWLSIMEETTHNVGTKWASIELLSVAFKVYYFKRGKNMSLVPHPEPNVELYWSYCKNRGDCVEKVIMQRQVEGNRKPGRPITRWIDQIDSLAQSSSLQELYSLSKDRQRWCVTVDITSCQSWQDQTNQPQKDPLGNEKKKTLIYGVGWYMVGILFFVYLFIYLFVCLFIHFLEAKIL